MKATIDFDDALYRRLKIEAARRGRTVRELVAEGVRYVLDGEPLDRSGTDTGAQGAPPAWFGVLGDYAATVDDHSPDAIRESVARARAHRDTP
jgi:hypothetical protein